MTSHEYDPANIGKRESSDGVNTITVYVSIGNSDDKLGQREWSDFVSDVNVAVCRYAAQVYGWWFSAPDAPWQNGVMAFLLDRECEDDLRSRLAVAREKFRQDSIAWAEVHVTEFI
jgi:hypothetical protein